MTLETLSTLKNPPVVYAKQANIAHGPQQMNNGGVPSTRTEEKKSSPVKHFGGVNEQSMDGGTPGAAGRNNSGLEAARKLTGPKTADGKAIVAGNAFKDGNRPLLRASLRDIREALKVLDLHGRI